MDDDFDIIDANDMKDSDDPIVPEVESKDATPTDSSPEETKEEPEVVDESKDDSELTEEETGEDQSDEQDTPAEPDTEADSTEESKPQAKNSAENRIRSLANENRELKKQIEAQTAIYKPSDVQDLIDQGLEPADAKFQALEEKLQIQEFQTQVLATTSAMEREAQEVLHDFPIFDPQSDQYDKELASRVNNLYQKAAGIQEDPNTGAMYDVNVLPYDFYKEFAEARELGIKRGAVKGQQSAERNQANAEPTGSTPPKEQPKDPFLAGFED